MEGKNVELTSRKVNSFRKKIEITSLHIFE